MYTRDGNRSSSRRSARSNTGDAADSSCCVAWSGFYGAANGTLTLKLDIADNDVPGVWQIRVRELASGLIESGYVRVENGGK